MEHCDRRLRGGVNRQQGDSRGCCRARAPYFAARVGQAPQRGAFVRRFAGRGRHLQLQRSEILATVPGGARQARSLDHAAARVKLMRYTPAATLQVPYLKLHQFAYRHSGGLIGSRMLAGRALLLTTTGRRSGEPRTTALIYLKMANGWSWWPPTEGVITRPHARDSCRAAGTTYGRVVGVDTPSSAPLIRVQKWIGDEVVKWQWVTPTHTTNSWIASRPPLRRLLQQYAIPGARSPSWCLDLRARLP